MVAAGTGRGAQTRPRCCSSWTRSGPPSPHPHDRRRRLITVDEAWLLLAHPAGAQFLLRAAKAGRKHWAGLTVITQDTADVLSTDLGRAVIANAATQILLRQAPQALDHVASTFGLSAGERGFLAVGRTRRGPAHLRGTPRRVQRDRLRRPRTS